AQALRELDRARGLREPFRRGSAVDPVLPDELVERCARLPQRDRGPRIGDRCLDLAAVADDARVREEPLDVRVAEACDRVGLETGEGGAEALALTQDRQPGETRLEALEAEALVQAPLVANRPAPLLVVVRVVGRIRALPAANEFAHRPTFGRTLTRSRP